MLATKCGMKSQPHRSYWRASLAAVLLLLPSLAGAQSGGLLFERAQIRIDATPQKLDEHTVATLHNPIALDVEVRPEDSLRLEYIHTLNTLDATGGVMIAFDSPVTVALPAMKVYTPVDVLFVEDNGTIIQIMPNVVLGEINQTISAKKPIKAFLFLKAGMAAANKIHPRDVIAARMFTPAPSVQE